MKVNHPNRKFFVNLPDQLYRDLKDQIRKRPDLNIDFAVLLLYLILYPSKDSKSMDKWVHLCSSLLQDLDFRTFKYQEHLAFLQKARIIEISEYSNRQNGKGKCRGYKLSGKYIKY